MYQVSLTCHSMWLVWWAVHFQNTVSYIIEYTSIVKWKNQNTLQYQIETMLDRATDAMSIDKQRAD